MGEKQTIAFFGATGLVAGTALAHALLEGHHCTALARTPEKLTTLLTQEFGISDSVLKSQLTIVQGDAKDTLAISKALTSPLSPTHLVDTAVSGIGGVTVFNYSLLTPFTLTDLTICEDFITAFFQAFEDLAKMGIEKTVDGRKPLVVLISSAGVNGKSREIPIVYLPLYAYILQTSRRGKKAMEQAAMKYTAKRIRSFVLVRPTILSEGEPRGIKSLRIGWEWGPDCWEGDRNEEEIGPAIGYIVGKKDVGEWIWRKVVVGEGGGWEGKCVTVTY